MLEERVYRINLRIDDKRNNYYVRLSPEAAAALHDILLDVNVSFDWNKDFIDIERVELPKGVSNE